MTRIVAIGMSNTDLVCRAPRLPVAGETLAGTAFDMFAGGKGANQAVAAARSGAGVRFCGAVGADANGNERRADLEAERIDTSALQTIAGAVSGVALIVVADSGENQIVTVAGANGLVDAQTALRDLERTQYDLVLMTWELAPDTSAAILAGLAADVPIVLNTAPFHPSVKDVFPNGRVVAICNEVEAGQLLGRQVTIENALEAATDIQEMGCRAAIITLGAAGAVGADASQQWSVIPPDVDVVDTTGAGDSFCGAFAAWLTLGASFEEATLAGVHAGALATTVPGAQPSIPNRETIVASMNGVAAT